jgi:hypothetical protein
MLRTRFVQAVAAGCLLALASAFAASGQLVLSCKDGATSGHMQGPSRASDDALLVFDFDRNSLSHDRAAGAVSISAIKKHFITWKSDDGTRSGYLNRVTLEAVEQDGHARTTYACALYAHVSFKTAQR